IIPRISFSDRIRYSTSSTLYSVPLYLANSTLSPALTFIGTRRPLSSRRPSPTARTTPSIGRSLLAVSGRKMPPLVCASRSAGLTTTRSASGRMRKSATIVVVPPCHRTNRMRGRAHSQSWRAHGPTRTPPVRWELDTHLLWCGNHAELLQHPQRVKVPPALRDLAGGETVENDPGHRGGLARRRHPHHLTGVGAARGPTQHHPIPVSDHVVDRHPHVGKGPTIQANQAFLS